MFVLKVCINKNISITKDASSPLPQPQHFCQIFIRLIFNSWETKQNLTAELSVVQPGCLQSCRWMKQTLQSSPLERVALPMLLFIFWENWRIKVRNTWNLIKLLIRRSLVSPRERAGRERKCSTSHRKWGHLFVNSLWDFLWEGYYVIRTLVLVPTTQILPKQGLLHLQLPICRSIWSWAKGGLALSRPYLG